ADRIVVLQNGEIQEIGRTEQILSAPAHPYTRSLLAAMDPAARTASVGHAPQGRDDVILAVRDLEVRFGNGKAGGGKVVLQDINLEIRRGATVGVIGESGSGKTTLARAIAGLVTPSAGQVLLDGQALSPTLEGRTRDQFRRVQYVFQNADTALNPQHTIEAILSRPLKFYHAMTGEQRRKRVAELLELVRLPQGVAQRRPGELSGGQKQRINLARALAAEPDLILCDEVTSALDTVVGAAILELMAELRRELNVSYMFISHDLGTVRSICDEIIVLYAGRKVEVRQREARQEPPFHPYSHLLDSSIPMLRRGWLEEVSGRTATTLPPLAAAPSSQAGLCPFIDRCALRVDGLCNTAPPPLRQLAGGGTILCHRSEEDLVGAQGTLRLVAGEAA
ncbi:MAG TPA: ATP-binding cassette domain-containing protein, partial [Chiayiivirga sp.]|nr:ATP-binding cassette domain-containing protein [Chiayiivirga sp.]